MLKWETIDRARTTSGRELVLARRGNEWVVRVDNQTLMTSRMHDSEIALAEHTLSNIRDPRAVLVGGLGLGYTLRAVLDGVVEQAAITVVELVPELVAWNREHLAALNQQPLDDPRCRVVIGDVFDTIRGSKQAFDAILLDVDNGPQALTQTENQRLYADAGVKACHAALRQGGTLAVWSAGPNERYERSLRSHGFDVEVRRVTARVGSRAKHLLFLATRRAR